MSEKRVALAVTKADGMDYCPEISRAAEEKGRTLEGGTGDHMEMKQEDLLLYIPPRRGDGFLLEDGVCCAKNRKWRRDGSSKAEPGMKDSCTRRRHREDGIHKKERQKIRSFLEDRDLSNTLVKRATPENTLDTENRLTVTAFAQRHSQSGITRKGQTDKKRTTNAAKGQVPKMVDEIRCTLIPIGSVPTLKRSVLRTSAKMPTMVLCKFIHSSLGLSEAQAVFVRCRGKSLKENMTLHHISVHVWRGRRSPMTLEYGVDDVQST